MEDLWPCEACLQGPASNHPERHWLKTVVVSVGAKANQKGLSGMDREDEQKRTTVQASKSREMTSKPGAAIILGTSPSENLLTGWAMSGVEVA